jgi:GNAT superfamily N-acetyltransferase
MPECVAILRRVHEENAYPARWPQDPAGWITPAGLEAAWVAVHDDSIVGHVALVRGMNASCLLHATGRDASELGGIVRLFVDPSARRVGCARELLEAATSYAVAQGLQPVLDVVDDGLAAIALYEGAGWQLVGTELATWVTPAGLRPKVRWYVLPLQRPDGFPNIEWAVRPTPAAADGAVRPLPLCSGRAHAGFTASRRRRRSWYPPAHCGPEG